MWEGSIRISCHPSPPILAIFALLKMAMTLP